MSARRVATLRCVALYVLPNKTGGSKKRITGQDINHTHHAPVRGCEGHEMRSRWTQLMVPSSSSPRAVALYLPTYICTASTDKWWPLTLEVCRYIHL